MHNALANNDSQLRKEISLWEHSDKEKGQIYTRPEVVNFMLKIIGLNENSEIDNIRILEPSCGHGEFVLAIADYLINRNKEKPSIDQLMNKILAIDLVNTSVEIAKSKVHKLLARTNYTKKDINKLLSNWFLTADFLLEDIEPNFTHVIGNPPYVRVENIPKNLLKKYRSIYSTMTDRADLYIPFFEKSLSLLLDRGTLSFICTDRWTKNRYGKSLRNLISENYSLELFIDLYGIDAFGEDVMTYPAITQIKKIKRFKVYKTIVQHETSFSNKESDEIIRTLNGNATNIQIRKGIINGESPWLLGSSDQISIIKKLENDYPSLEDAGCKVFIGAATGANKTYIVDNNDVDIEPSRLLPVITAKELKNESIQWKGKYIINTYDDKGVVELNDYPNLSKYLNKHKKELCKRHIAKSNSNNWFKTIDRVYEDRSKLEKLLIPDISSDPIVIYDNGVYHPNNSIYYICSNSWNLHALRVVLLSNVTKIVISTYSTKIAKGYLRFQSQHLRKIRLPCWDDINNDLKTRMIEAGESNNTNIFTSLTCEMYNLNEQEKLIIGY